MTLEEQLARRLKAAGDGYWNEFGHAPDRPSWGEISPHAQEEYRAMAREVVRCMRWQLAAAGEATRIIGPECKEVPVVVWEQWAHIIETGPLTLPDDGWKP